ncbi:hypothetical protein PO909_033179 [Leuciscus waleckii]
MTDLMMDIGLYLTRCTAADSERVSSERARARQRLTRAERENQRPASVQLTSSTGRCPSGPAENDSDRPLFPRIARRWQPRGRQVGVERYILTHLEKRDHQQQALSMCSRKEMECI